MAAKRKPFCKHYDFCLAKAAHGNVDLTCTGCPDFEHMEFSPTDFDVAGSYALVAAVFKPEYTDDTPQELVSEFLKP